MIKDGCLNLFIKQATLLDIDQVEKTIEKHDRDWVNNVKWAINICRGISLDQLLEDNEVYMFFARFIWCLSHRGRHLDAVHIAVDTFYDLCCTRGTKSRRILETRVRVDHIV